MPRYIDSNAPDIGHGKNPYKKGTSDNPKTREVKFVPIDEVEDADGLDPTHVVEFDEKSEGEEQDRYHEMAEEKGVPDDYHETDVVYSDYIENSPFDESFQYTAVGGVVTPKDIVPDQGQDLPKREGSVKAVRTRKVYGQKYSGELRSEKRRDKEQDKDKDKHNLALVKAVAGRKGQEELVSGRLGAEEELVKNQWSKKNKKRRHADDFEWRTLFGEEKAKQMVEISTRGPENLKEEVILNCIDLAPEDVGLIRRTDMEGNAIKNSDAELFGRRVVRLVNDPHVVHAENEQGETLELKVRQYFDTLIAFAEEHDEDLKEMAKRGAGSLYKGVDNLLKNQIKELYLDIPKRLYNDSDFKNESTERKLSYFRMALPKLLEDAFMYESWNRDIQVSTKRVRDLQAAWSDTRATLEKIISDLPTQPKDYSVAV